MADGGGIPAAADVQRGADRVAKLLVMFEKASRVQLERQGAPLPTHEIIWVNGEPSVLTLVDGKLLHVTVLQVEGHRITALYRVLNPEKLTALNYPTLLQ